MFEYYEPCLALDLESPEIDTSQFSWHQYNPRKTVQRFGVSLTSLDGKMTGIPDLDSLFEYNKLNNTDYTEMDFTAKTPVYDQYFKFLDNHFEIGRSHILRLGQGGFFPFHRDFDPNTFRLIYTISGCEPHNFVWILNDQVVKFQNRRWYYVNTKMIHSVFSFFGCEFAVFNVKNNPNARMELIRNLHVK